MDFSIIIPTFNRCQSVQRTLQSLTAVDFPPDRFEILLVDNGSQDGTEAVFRGAAAAAPQLTWKYFSEPMPGLLSGRHKGALESQAEICAFIDDDVRLGRDWLNALRDSFGDPSVVLAGGPSRPIFEVPPPVWLEDFYGENDVGRACPYLSLLEGPPVRRQVDAGCIWGLNYAMRREALFTLGGFHPDNLPSRLQRFQGDGESGLSLKLKRAGLRAVYHPEASVQHEVAQSRLTPAYFQARGRYQGVCDSYTAIRASSSPELPPTPERRPGQIIREFGKTAVGKIFGRTRSVHDLMRLGYAEGYAFHQQEVRADDALLAWVRREDYWDYSLPTGWERYQAPAKSPSGLVEASDSRKPRG